MHEVLPEFSYNLPSGNLVLAKAMRGKARCQNCAFRNNGTDCAELKPTETLQRNCADVGFYWNIRQKED